MLTSDLDTLQRRALKEHDLDIFDLITTERILGDGEIVNNAIYGACRRWRLYHCLLCGRLRHYPARSHYDLCEQSGGCIECWEDDYRRAQRRLARYTALTIGGGIQRLAERWPVESDQRARYRQFYQRCNEERKRIATGFARLKESHL